MHWKTPHWWAQRTMVARLLSPIGWLVMRGPAWRRWRVKPVRVDASVICVGNAVAGGAGKTPVVMALVQLLKAQGLAVHIITRGYGGQQMVQTALRVNLRKHTARDVGDEALMLAQVAPCWVGRNRVHSARAAIAAGAQVVVMDDGWQYPNLRKDLSLLVVDGAFGIGNGYGLPAGPLREPWKAALARADAVVCLGHDAHALTAAIAPRVWHAKVVAPEKEMARWQGASVWLFAGIGRPEKFYDTMRAGGAQIAGTTSFADHHTYSERELEQLAADARHAQATLVTTQKDWVRLPSQWQVRIAYLPVQCEWEDANAVSQWLKLQLLR